MPKYSVQKTYSSVRGERNKLTMNMELLEKEESICEILSAKLGEGGIRLLLEVLSNDVASKILIGHLWANLIMQRAK